MIIKTDYNNIQKLRELWQVCFPEVEDFTNFFFDMMFPNAEVFSAVEDGELCGAVYVFDYAFSSGMKAKYLYGVGTFPEYRGQGIAGKIINAIIEDAKSRGSDLCMLVPQKPSLYDFYSRFGFVKNFFLDKKTHELMSSGFALQKAEKLDVPTLNAIYEKHVEDKDALLRDEREWSLLIDEFNGFGEGIYLLDTRAYCAISVENGEVIASEVCGEDAGSIADILSAVADKFGKKVEWYLSGKTPYGMLLPLTERARELSATDRAYANLLHH